MATGHRVAVLALLVAVPASAFAAETQAVRSVTYHVTLSPHMRPAAVPYTGLLQLKYTPDGLISGSYRGTSIRPDSLNNTVTAVSGGTDGKYIHLNFGVHWFLTAQGTLEGGKIRATAWWRNRLYDMVAEPV